MESKNMNIKDANAYIKKFDEKIQKPRILPPETEFYVGVDLGTANIVISVVDKNGEPLGGATYPSSVVKDGIVVDFIGAIKIVRDLKEKVEKDLGIEITQGFTAIPPGVEAGSVKAISNVIESAEIDVVKVIDEPTAAAKT
jgi:ethanolamine utilization protein EutJ